MKKVLGGILFLVVAGPAFSCGNNLVVYRETSVGFSFGGNGAKLGSSSSRYVEVPIRVGNQSGCWKQKDLFSVDIKEQSSTQKGQITFFLPESKFENIPNPHHELYIRVNAFEEYFQVESEKVKISVLSLTCTGQGVLSVETFESSLGELVSYNGSSNTSLQQSLMLSTGAGVFKSTKRKPAPLLLLESLKRKDQEEDLFNHLPEIHIPTIYLRSQLQVNEFALDNDFTTASVMPLACTDWFKEQMQAFHIDNVNGSKSGGFSLKKKKGFGKKRLEFKWKL